jgi:hypothetical protein
VKRAYLLAFGFLSCASFADSGNVPAGTTLTTGATSNGHSLFSPTINPAVAAITIGNDEKWRLNYLPSLAFAGEVGDVNDFADDLDELIDLLDDPSLADGSMEETRDRFNRVLTAMGKSGYLKVSTGLHIPLFPMYWRPSEFSGTYFIEAAVDTQIKLSLLDEPLDYDDQHTSFSTGSAAYLKSGIEKRFAVGYARATLNEKQSAHWGGQLYVGTKIKLLNLELSKQVMPLQQLGGRDVEDLIEDEYKNNLSSNTNVSVDVGISWISRHYRAGLLLSNINSPSFRYGDIGTDCQQFPEGSFARNNCEAAAYFAYDQGRINSSEKHTKHAAATLDGSLFPTSNWAVNLAIDLAPYDDIVGDEIQRFNISSAWNSHSVWLPDIRLGYQKNLAGSKLASAGLGISFFDVFTVDAQIALDDVLIDGKKAPRSFALAIAFEEKF